GAAAGTVVAHNANNQDSIESRPYDSQRSTGQPMEVPLTPLDFFRRARRLYAGRPAVVDGDHRWTYAEFGARCDRWSAWLQSAGVAKGDRVAYICPNTHAQLESFYAVPQIGGVLVPLNFRLIADDFKYL